MNWEHLKTYIWVRWRLSANQVKRSGKLGALIAAILAGLRILGGVLAFIIGLIVGIFALNHAEPRIIMAVWDGVAAGFILFWMIGLISELQRTELLSLDNFMHLPVSPSGAFLINYIGSSIGLSLILFLPAMMGLSMGLTVSRGPAMLSLFPLVVSFFLMITAVTYQFRGWLAGMMTNPRRRRTVIAVVSLAFILALQLPNILTNFNPGFREQHQASQQTSKEIDLLDKNLADGQITETEYDKKVASKRAALESERKRGLEKGFATIRMINLVFPPGWLPHGTESAAQGRFLPVGACVLGMALIGIISLRRSYRTSIRLYTGDFNKGRTKRRKKPRTISKESSIAKTASGLSTTFLEKTLPGMSEHASAVALAGLRSLSRATEAKMMLLAPVIMLIVFGGMLATNRGTVTGLFRPLSAIGLSAMILILSMAAFVGNLFAFDRHGFRVFVLSGVPRREILYGKNLSYLPFAIALMALVVIVSQWLYPMRWDHLAAVLVQIFPIYLLFCLMGNMLSILFPLTLKQGSGMPAPHQGVAPLFQMIFMAIVPVPIAFTLIPLGIESMFSIMGWMVGFPIFLTLGLLQAVIVWRLYRRALNSQGNLLQRHEKKILEVVSQKGE